MLIGSLFALANGVSLLFYSFPFAQLINALNPLNPAEQIVNQALQAFKLFGLNSLIVFVNSWVMSTAWSISSERQMSKARLQYFRALLEQDTAWYNKERPAQLCANMYEQIERVHHSLVHNVTSMLLKISLGLSGVIISLVTGWAMTLVILGFLPLMILAGHCFAGYIKQY